jgi:hypothetical protein
MSILFYFFYKWPKFLHLLVLFRTLVEELRIQLFIYEHIYSLVFGYYLLFVA